MKFSNRIEKLAFLNGLQKQTRSLDELRPIRSYIILYYADTNQYFYLDSAKELTVSELSNLKMLNPYRVIVLNLLSKDNELENNLRKL